ncbi:hypothetical protein LOTGIDRAFT_170921 [Lottia gigantea]|uniref:DNA-directed DNA polymerase n=1 Tax=Lottia gigantea TaxID=225164 RepID=V4AJ76_LOTGI|nr:hypothetical protein LOTGIDRAFT_170921 [Lottia gigantea]ESP04224.1 hypothetical protein LOTGIDRAFT_170921 [Lottia gigantea]
MDEICNLLKEYTEFDSSNIIDLFKEYNTCAKDKTEVHTKLKELDYSKVMAFDANGLYASAMSDLESEYPKGESERPFLPEENEEFVKLFNGQKFRPRTAILKSLELRNKYKKEGDEVGSNCMKLLGNSLYSKSIQKDITTSRHLWSETTFKANFDSHVKNYEKVNETQYIFEIEEEEKEFIPPKDSTRLTPSHIGSKKTFKGYSNYKIKVDDYIQLASRHDVMNEFKKPWGKSFSDGIVIPNDEDKQKKVFRSYLNLVKRKAPDDEGIMYPYNDGKELNMDENYEFDDFDYLTIQEENEECLITE